MGLMRDNLVLWSFLIKENNSMCICIRKWLYENVKWAISISQPEIPVPILDSLLKIYISFKINKVSFLEDVGGWRMKNGWNWLGIVSLQGELEVTC